MSFLLHKSENDSVLKTVFRIALVAVNYVIFETYLVVLNRLVYLFQTVCTLPTDEINTFIMILYKYTRFYPATSTPMVMTIMTLYSSPSNLKGFSVLQLTVQLFNSSSWIQLNIIIILQSRPVDDLRLGAFQVSVHLRCFFYLLSINSVPKIFPTPCWAMTVVGPIGLQWPFSEYDVDPFNYILFLSLCLYL